MIIKLLRNTNEEYGKRFKKFESCVETDSSLKIITPCEEAEYHTTISWDKTYSCMCHSHQLVPIDTSLTYQMKQEVR